MAGAEKGDAETARRLVVEIETRPRSAAGLFAPERRDLERPRPLACRLRLWRPEPMVAIGREQAVAREVRLSHCRPRAIPVARRPTGGGALWLDPDQVALTLTLPAERLGASPGDRLGRGIAILRDALARLGVATTARPPNDVEVAGGAKIASVFLGGEGDAALLFATLLVDFDVEAAMKALLVPTEKLTVTGLEHARERVTTLRRRLATPPAAAAIESALIDAVADALGCSPVRVEAAAEGDDAADADLLEAPDPWAEHPLRGWETADKTPHATLRLRLELDATGARIAAARFATDAAAVPAGLAARVAATLADAPLDALVDRMRAAADFAEAAAVGFGPADLVRLAERALAKARLAAEVGLDPAQTSGLMLAGGARDAAEVLGRANVVLVPYCAKPAWCALRPTPDCIECGNCEVGDAYRMARDRGLEVATITDFEHLSATLAAMKARGDRAYVGMCCSDFFLKRHAAFREAGLDAVLMDVVGATCYELAEEHLAYAGAFKAEARLDLDALEKVMSLVPGCDAADCAAGGCGRPPGGDDDAAG